MIQRGWQDGVATVAPHVPGLADLVEQRLAEAVRLGRLDEAGLLSIVDAATQLAADMGAVDIAPALSKRLRRHVYEYLLSLDAVNGSSVNGAAVQAAVGDDRGTMNGAGGGPGLAESRLTEVGTSIPESNGHGVHRFPSPYAGTETTHPLAEPEYPEPEAAYPGPEPAYPQPRSRYDEPEPAYGEPEAAYGEPEAAYGEPEATYGEPEVAYGEPEVGYGEPEVEYGEPEAAHAEPEAAHGEPEAAYRGPAVAYGEPESRYPLPDSPYPLSDSPYPFAASSSSPSDEPYAPPDEDAGTSAGEGGRASSLPQFSFHIGDPDDLHAPRNSQQEQGAVVEAVGPSGAFDALPETPKPDQAAPARRASFADPSTWPKPVTPTLRGSRDPLAEGLRDEMLSPDDLPVSSAPDGTRFQDVGPWPAAPAADPPHRSGPPDMARWSSPWPAPETPPNGRNDAQVSPMPSTPAIADFEPATGPARHDGREDWRDAATGWLPASPSAGPSAGPGAGPGASPSAGLGSGPGANAPEISPNWSVRQQEAVELHMAPAPGDVAPAPPANDVPERDLVALRKSVDERLRKKRCDDVAAVLQQAAQELGGQAVAELALDAGDRCRSLGKRNAALNCYLAASRADPVYEPPLARLADICIDDQDIDLAVSYLERIARLTRLRGDNHGALRIYRKIATIAPYRDDVLEMLMRAQTTGRMDP
jgi:hypothetical protein